MNAIQHTGHRAAATILALSMLWAFPARALEEAVEARAAASAEAPVGSAERMATLSDSDAMALTVRPPRKKPARIVRAPSQRLAALSNHDLRCSGAWCGRQFVLIIGIGF
jgi:hypothetical protein